MLVGRIQLLASCEVKKIAAGQVIERPVNVVKELVENSLDAKAVSIDIFIFEGGIKSLRVIDDGCGMSVDDAHLCFAPHATSKISVLGDLNTIETFGFRGEALASIAAVSKVRLVTRQECDSEGIALELEAGAETAEQAVACGVGTDIEVCDLFCYVPVRKKFLKNSETEFRQIVQLFQAFVLSHVHVHFKLFHNDQLVYNYPGVDDLSKRAAQIFDAHITRSMIPFAVCDNKIKVEIQGFISDHQYGRYNTSSLYLFANKRWIKNQTLTKALIRAYTDVLPRGKYPAGCISITIDPMMMDVNVHPKKDEVRFIFESIIVSLLQSTIKKLLETRVTQNLGFLPMQSSEKTQSLPTHAAHAVCGFEEPLGDTQQDSALFVQKNFMPIVENVVAQAAISAMPMRSIIGQYRNTYIMLEQYGDLILVDQHAAHERILYQRFKQKFSESETTEFIFSPLIFVGTSIVKRLPEVAEIFARHAIVLEPMGPDSIRVCSVPVHLKDINLEDLIVKAVDEFGIVGTDFDHALCARMACHAAVKAGDTLSHVHMERLLADLENCENKLTCPHGRPTTWRLSQSDIERKFKRII